MGKEANRNKIIKAVKSLTNKGDEYITGNKIAHEMKELGLTGRFLMGFGTLYNGLDELVKEERIFKYIVPQDDRPDLYCYKFVR